MTNVTKVNCPVCKRSIGTQTHNGTTKIARHQSHAPASMAFGSSRSLPGHYPRCAGSGTVIAHG